jgi:hypothetical protein
MGSEGPRRRGPHFPVTIPAQRAKETLARPLVAKSPTERERGRLPHRIAGISQRPDHEFGEGFCTLYMYGPDADALFKAVESDLRSAPLPAGSYAIKRYGSAGDPEARETRVVLR